jgi:hypothetical protein
MVNAPISTPDKNYGGNPFRVSEDWKSDITDYVWRAGRVYGSWNTSTIKALEKRGLIKIHSIGGWMSDEVELT